MPADVVRQQTGDLGAQRFSIAKRNENAAPVAQELLGVPVGCRYDCLSQSKTVRQRARRHLGFIEIGSRVDVAHRNEVQQRGLIHELVEKNDMIFDAESLHARRQAFAIGLALLPHQLRMSSAKNDIDGIRARFNDFRHGIEHDLDAFVRRQETEGQNDHLSGEVEFGLGVMCFEEREIRYSVRYDLNLASWHVVNGTEEFVAFFRHDDDFCRNVHDPTHHVVLALPSVWRAPYAVS